MREILEKVAHNNNCQNCDGVGYYEGCMDDTCGTWACYKCLEILDKQPKCQCKCKGKHNENT